jgi:four helix bundle protein
MEAKFKFEKLIIWQKAMEYGEKLFELSNSFPKKEVFNLSSQILRTGDSITLNISEGAMLQSTKEFHKFLGYSIRSLVEVVTCLHKAQKRKYIENQSFETLYSEAYSLMNMMVVFKKNTKELNIRYRSKNSGTYKKSPLENENP